MKLSLDSFWGWMSLWKKWQWFVDGLWSFWYRELSILFPSKALKWWKCIQLWLWLSTAQRTFPYGGDWDHIGMPNFLLEVLRNHWGLWWTSICGLLPLWTEWVKSWRKESCFWIVYTDRGTQLPLCNGGYGLVVVFPRETKINIMLQGTKWTPTFSQLWMVLVTPFGQIH